MAAQKTCPACAEDVKAAAKVCRYCGHQFDLAAEKAAARKTAKKRGLIFLAVVVGLIIIANTGEKTSTSAETEVAEGQALQDDDRSASPGSTSERGRSTLHRILFGDRSAEATSSELEAEQPDAAPTLDDTVARVIRERRAAPQAQQSDGRASIEFMIDPWALTASTARDSFVLMTADLIALVFEEHDDIDSLTISATGSFTDDRANEFRQEALSVTYSRETASTINWGNLASIGYDRVLDLADDSTVHPAFRP